jgi:hypothetical protein
MSPSVAAPVHTANIVKRFLDETFGDRIIAQGLHVHPFRGVRFPPRSPDHAVLDIFLFKEMKGKHSTIYNL